MPWVTPKGPHRVPPTVSVARRTQPERPSCYHIAHSLQTCQPHGPSGHTCSWGHRAAMCDLRSGGGEASPGHREGSPGRGIGPASDGAWEQGALEGAPAPGRGCCFRPRRPSHSLEPPDRVIEGAGQQDTQNSQECLGDKCRPRALAQKGKTGSGDAQGGAGRGGAAGKRRKRPSPGGVGMAAGWPS